VRRGGRRTTGTEATGTESTKLPELQLSAPGITVQALPARLENRLDRDQLIGIREQAFLITPARAGIIPLPAVQLPWWTPDGVPMTATLPARALQGLAGTAQAPPSATDGDVDAHPDSFALSLWWLPLAAMLGVVLVRALLRRHHRRLMRACRRGDARAVRSGLLAWAADTWRHAPPRTLGTLAERLQDARAREALAQLDRSLYGALLDGKTDPTALRTTVLRVLRSKRHPQYDSPASRRAGDGIEYIDNTGWK